MFVTVLQNRKDLIMDITKYKISDTQYLQINPECIHDDECKTCAEIDIDYIDEVNNICIRFGRESAHSFCYYIIKSGAIPKLIAGIKTLDKSITHDVGFEWNQYFADKRGPTEADKYFWTSNSHKHIRPYYSSWLYNDQDGNIIFEITPDYPWFYETKKTCPDKISYKEWIKNYKPTIKTIIPKENLQHWVEQAQELDQQLKD
jgi:hypothetical protein